MSDRQDEEPTQLDRIEAKLDQIITRLTPRPIKHEYDFGGDDEQQKEFAQALRNAVKAEGGHIGKPRRRRRFGLF